MPNPHGPSPNRVRQGHVLRAIADDPRRAEIQSKGEGRGSGHAGGRLAVFAVSRKGFDESLRVVRAEEVQVDLGAVLGQLLGNVGMDSFHVGDPVVAPRHSRLIADNGHREAGTVERSDRFRRAF